jgi:UDP-3-O-[3-hydroxymyristoyl] glucosamine N-acyltransferase
MKLTEIAEFLSGELRGNGSVNITGIARIEDAGEGDITYISHPKYEKWLTKTDASCIIVSRNTDLSTTKTLLFVDEPTLAIVKLADLFYKRTPPIAGISPLADVSKDTVVDKTASISAFCVICSGCRLGKGTVLFPQVYLGEGSQVGDNCVIYPRVVIRENVRIKNRVVIHPGCVIGADGFGYIEKAGERVKIPHFGGVVIEDDVEIGANSTIDRATLGDTIIGKGTKIDNLVHIAHNVVIGENSVIVAQVGIAGSTEIGSNVIIAGQAGISDHLTIGNNVKIGAQSGVTKSVKNGEEISGYPAREHRRSKKAYALLMRLPEIYERFKKIEKKLGHCN